ncbi:PREDICTED: uncharacterized protein LOC106818518 [Priapulus caudatus]|uniref:Uncharacterized protein LOC106818518 n=1 Tax=Priapulus caudatus TaxID=37621 RepID=A0ABM1F2N3_PRICU|nr:PREDICTED: uncharacterized protein LOC106818518 [Priapulus caudatus]
MGRKESVEMELYSARFRTVLLVAMAGLLLMALNQRMETYSPQTIYVRRPVAKLQSDEVVIASPSASRQYKTKFPPSRTGRQNTGIDGKLKVPNVLHYVWLTDPKAKGATIHSMTLYRMLGPISACRNLRPDRIILHSNQRPSGRLWDELFRIVPIEHEYYPDVKEVFGQPVDNIAHRSDVARIDIIRSHGGIYLDFDVVVLKSFDPLRVHDCVLGVESGKAAGTRNMTNAGVIIGAKNATFLNMWYDGYRDYRENWLYNSAVVPNKLRAKHGQLLHVDPNIWHDTSGHIFKSFADLSHTYAYHMWVNHNFRNVPGVNKHDINPQDAFLMNNTFGELLLRFYTHYYWLGNTSVPAAP